MRNWIILLGIALAASLGRLQPAAAQLVQIPQSNPSVSVRTIQGPTASGTTNGFGPMVPLGPPGTPPPSLTPTPTGSVPFDPYSTRPSYQNPPTSVFPPTTPTYGTGVYPTPTYGSPTFGSPTYSSPTYGSPNLAGPISPPVYPSANTYGTPVYPSTITPGGLPPGSVAPGATFGGGLPTTGPIPSTINPSYPGMGQSGSIGVYNNGLPGVYPPGAIPSTTPPSLFPTPMMGTQGSLFGGPTNPYGFGGSSGVYPYNTWNPQGTLATSIPGSQQFIRFFQGPRFRHTWVFGNEDPDALMINDTDVSLAFAIPTFLGSTQPLYLLPSFSLHNWDGPNGTAADLPPIAYSAFLDTGWQSDPLRIAGAEVGVRVGVFTDFDTYSDDSLRVMGRALGRVRLTPTATLKGGIVYLDRNEIEWLPAGGLLWQPNPATRFDIFFPEPKLSHYLSTIGNFDTWWYINGYYGGGSWTVKRANGTEDSIDINDLRVNIGLEWGRNDQLRNGQRIGFVEVGYVFNRELIYKSRPQDNLELQDSFVIRAGLGY